MIGLGIIFDGEKEGEFENFKHVRHGDGNITVIFIKNTYGNDSL